MAIPRYIIRPHPTEEGYVLTGPRIPYGLWYLRDENAASYAHWIARNTGGVLIVIDRGGYSFSETIEKDAPREPDAYGGLSV